jgi:hypothetical protein
MATTRRILTIDGGGVRGAFSAAIIEEMERANGGKAAWEIFDCFCGTSAGSLIAAGLAAGHHAGDLKRLFIEMGKSIAQAPDEAGRTEALEAGLRAFFGDLRAGDLKRRLAVPARDMRTGQVAFFGNFPPDRLEPPSFWSGTASLDEPVWKMVLRSASLPPLFEPRDDFVDGGLSPFANPSYAAYIGVQRRLGWNPHREGLRFYSVGSGYTVQRCEGLATLKEIDLYKLLLTGMMQDVNFLQHQIMKRRMQDGRIWYRRYNISFTPEGFERFGIPVPDQRELEELSQTMSPFAERLAEIGTKVGEQTVHAGDFEPLPPRPDQRVLPDRRLARRRRDGDTEPPAGGGERRVCTDRRRKKRRVLSGIQPASPTP